MFDDNALREDALSAVIDEILVTADAIESQAAADAAALVTLGEERAARIRRKAYEMHLRLHP